jgi:hypothetical protein
MRCAATLSPSLVILSEAMDLCISAQGKLREGSLHFISTAKCEDASLMPERNEKDPSLRSG